MKKIKNITVGIDFSVTARGAYRYAKALAQLLDATLTLVHVNEGAVMVSDVVTPSSLSQGDNDRLVSDIKQMIAEEDAAGMAGAVDIKVLTGNTVDIFTELTGTDLIVIGTTGLSDVTTKLFGSTSLKISNQSHCPVVLVPRGAQWQPIKQVLFASDYDSMTPQAVNRVIDFSNSIQAGIHFVNVRNYDPILEPRQKDIDWSALVTGEHASADYIKATVYGNDTVAELKKYSDTNHTDFLVFTSKHRNFWSNLTHKSITGNMALSATVPVMVMHQDDKE